MTTGTSPKMPGANVPEMSVSELAFSLKRTLEEGYARVRIRGELSRVKIHTSGHMYSDLKDADAVINVVCWKASLAKLSVRPEEGLEVVCTGRITTYPARSNYQLVIESMELAGEGALLKMLEDRRKRLAAEGLFDPKRKKPLPFLPEIIGVITSPTGAVIRDIMHRLNDRFPRRVLLWPVLVQGPGAADQVTKALQGFNAMTQNRPDLLIVARGGGSLEDLMPFNEESVVRAVAASAIPVISAVGHETDTTLIDYAADLRAPTPTGAAEMAVPERMAFLAQVREDQERMTGGMMRLIADLKNVVRAQSAHLRDPRRLLEAKMQAFDHLSDKLGFAFERGLGMKVRQVAELGAMLRHPRERIREAAKVLELHGQALNRVFETLLRERDRTLAHVSRMLESLSFERVLDRGFAVVRDTKNAVISDAADVKPGQTVAIQFRGNRKIPARVEGKAT